MHILFATAELAPFTPPTPGARSCAALASALRAFDPASVLTPEERMRTDLRTIAHPITSLSIIMPLHGFIDPEELHLARRISTLSVPFGSGQETVTVYEGFTPDRVQTFFLEHPKLLSNRKHVFGAPNRQPYRNNAERYAFFSRCVLEFSRTFSRITDIIHCWDWPTALIPTYLNTHYAEDPALADVLTLFHTLDFTGEEGSFAPSFLKQAQLTEDRFEPDQFSSNDILHKRRANLLKSALIFADLISLPSPSLSTSLQEASSGSPFPELFEARDSDLRGVIAGMDREVWNPALDAHLDEHFDSEKLYGKRVNKAQLQHIFELPTHILTPLACVVGDLSDEAATTKIAEAARLILSEDPDAFQIVVVGHNGGSHLSAWTDLAKDFPQAVGLHFRDDDALYHRCIAGADILIDAGQHKASGLDVIRAMRYGTLPVVHASGVHPFLLGPASGEELPSKQGAGVLFYNDSPEDIRDALHEAFELYAQPKAWRPILNHCMDADFTQRAAARTYINIYKSLAH